MIKTTKKDFEIFKKECRKWIDFFNLHEWDIEIFHKNDETGKFICAFSVSYPISMNAAIYLSEEWDESQSAHEEISIKQSAFHEVCEVMLSQITEMCRFTFSEQECRQKIHNIIHKLEHSIFFKQNRK